MIKCNDALINLGTKFVYSAAANGIHNLGFNEGSLFIIKAE